MAKADDKYDALAKAVAEQGEQLAQLIAALAPKPAPAPAPAGIIFDGPEDVKVPLRHLTPQARAAYEADMQLLADRNRRKAAKHAAAAALPVVGARPSVPSYAGPDSSSGTDDLE